MESWADDSCMSVSSRNDHLAEDFPQIHMIVIMLLLWTCCERFFIKLLRQDTLLQFFVEQLGGNCFAVGQAKPSCCSARDVKTRLACNLLRHGLSTFRVGREAPSFMSPASSVCEAEFLKIVSSFHCQCLNMTVLLKSVFFAKTWPMRCG